MLFVQNLVNGLLLGGLYVCIAIGFSLIWGVLNIINFLHGSLIVLGGYIAFYAFIYFGISPFLAPLFAMPMMFIFGYVLQRGVLNRVIGKPVLITLTLTFGLDLILNNLMIWGVHCQFSPRRVRASVQDAGNLRHNHSRRPTVRHGARYSAHSDVLLATQPLADRSRDRSGAQ